MHASEALSQDVAQDAYQFIHRLVDASAAAPLRPRAPVSVFDLFRFQRETDTTRRKRSQARIDLPVPAPSKKGVRPGSRPAQLLDLLGKCRDADIYDIAQAFGINVRHASAITTDMKNRGLLVEGERVNGRTRYALPKGFDGAQVLLR